LILSMITQEKIQDLLEPVLTDSGIFLVDVDVSKTNRIKIFVDSERGITIDECAKISRELESKLNRDIEDFELEVSSPGVGTPLKVYQQYLKNIGREVEIVKNDGMNIRGELIGMNEKRLSIETKGKRKSGKGSLIQTNVMDISFMDIKTTRVII